MNLDESLRHIFGKYLYSYSVESKANIEPIMTMGGVTHAAYNNYAYHVFSVTLRVSTVETLDGVSIIGPSMMQMAEEVSSHNCRMRGCSQQIDMGYVVFVAHYMIADIEVWSKEIENKAWIKYNREMNKLIDQVLSD